MNSCLYKATVMHHRLEPKPHRFHYGVYMFYIDLDEIDEICRKFRLISRNRFNMFSFRDSEHLQLPVEKPDKNKSIKEHIIAYLRSNGFKYSDQKIMLLTNLNVLGYNFNPVSFYFIQNAGCTECVIAEVSNTFREMKPYFIGGDCLREGKFALRVQKFFYVSPFIDHDASFDFQLTPPAEKLNIRIDDYKNDKRFFISTLTGEKKILCNTNLLFYSLRFPFITLKVISLIHWNALLLWIKKIPYHKKASNPELQKDVYKKYGSG